MSNCTHLNSKRSSWLQERSSPSSIGSGSGRGLDPICCITLSRIRVVMTFWACSNGPVWPSRFTVGSGAAFTRPVSFRCFSSRKNFRVRSMHARTCMSSSSCVITDAAAWKRFKPTIQKSTPVNCVVRRVLTLDTAAYIYPIPAQRSQNWLRGRTTIPHKVRGRGVSVHPLQEAWRYGTKLCRCNYWNIEKQLQPGTWTLHLPVHDHVNLFKCNSSDCGL